MDHRPEPDAVGDGVVHMDLGTPAWANADRPSPVRRLFVFWSSDRPVGQLWINADEDPLPRTQAFVASLPSLPASDPTEPMERGVSVVVCTRDRPGELA